MRESKTALFYVNPAIVRNQLTYYKGAIEKKLSRIAQNLKDNGYDVTIIANEFDASWVKRHFPVFNVIECSVENSFEMFGSLNNHEEAIYQSQNVSQSEVLSTFIETAGIEEPELVVVWETPSSFLQTSFPNAKILNLMPGFLSRVPFPELYTIDTQGLFKEASFYKTITNESLPEPHPEAVALLEDIRNDLLPSMEQDNPFTREVLDPESKYKRLVLVPLQITDHYAFKADCTHESQLSMLFAVMQALPSDVGVVVTQYNSKSASELAMDSEKLEMIQAKWPNLIYDKRFELLDHISQYLVSTVDAVISFSSSIGLQALLWSKPFVSLGQSHIHPFATHSSVSDWLTDFVHDDERRVEADKKLCYLLSTYNVMVTQYFDAKFFAKWISAFENSGGELPCVFDIDPQYRENFMRSVKVDKGLNVYKTHSEKSSSSTVVDNFRKALADTAPQLISFDIFDTLIERSVEQPIHVFKLMEEEVRRITAGVISNFSDVRRVCEKSLRDRIRDQDIASQEISLDEIYDHMADYFDVDTALINQIKQLEMKEELRQLKVRPSGRALFDMAINQGARVVLISDMYLPAEFIQRVMQEAGYPAELPLYLSSTIGVRKHEGELFDYVKKTENINVKHWLHVGDNPHGDISIPAAKGIQGFQIKSAYQGVAQNQKYGSTIRQSKQNQLLGESAVFGLIQKRFFSQASGFVASNTHFDGNPFMLGYAGLGMLLFGYLSWLMNQAKNSGIETIVFLSRDAKVLFQMAEILYPTSEGWPKLRYGLASRRSIRLGNLRSKSDIIKLANSSLSSISLRDFFSRKFNVILDVEDCQALAEVGVFNVDVKVNALTNAILIDAALKLSSRILEESQKQREMLKSYYADLGIISDKQCAVVDIGYSGSLQAGISEITGCPQLQGYYYITFNTAKEWEFYTGKMHGYAGEFVNPKNHADLICKNGFLYETLFNAAEYSFWCFNRLENGEKEPVFDVVDNDAARRVLVKRIHQGAVVLAKDLKQNFGHTLQSLLMPSTTASRILEDFIKHPSELDSAMFEGCIFDDGFSGEKLRYIVPPRAEIKRDLNSIKAAIWKEGSKALSQLYLDSPKAKSGNVFRKLNRKLFGNQHRIEATAIALFLKSKRKKLKYTQDRIAFFRDSQHPIIKCYYQVMVSNKL